VSPYVSLQDSPPVHPSAILNHDAHDYFGDEFFPDINALLAYHSTTITGDESTLLAAANSTSPLASNPPFRALQTPSDSFVGLDRNNTVGENFSFDSLFECHSCGHSMNHDPGWGSHITLATTSRALDHPLSNSRPATASVESHAAPSTIQNPKDQRLTNSSQPSHAATVAPPTPSSPYKHNPFPTQASSPSGSGDNKPLLHISIDSGHEGIVRILLDSGVDINERDRDGSTALHLAVQMRQDAVIRLLLEEGASTNVKDCSGKTPMHLAIYANFETGLKILLDHDTMIKKRT